MYLLHVDRGDLTCGGSCRRVAFLEADMPGATGPVLLVKGRAVSPPLAVVGLLEGRGTRKVPRSGVLNTAGTPIP